jgi:hypothetical protein
MSLRGMAIKTLFYLSMRGEGGEVIIIIAQGWHRETQREMRGTVMATNCSRSQQTERMGNRTPSSSN